MQTNYYLQIDSNTLPQVSCLNSEHIFRLENKFCLIYKLANRAKLDFNVCLEADERKESSELVFQQFSYRQTVNFVT